MKNRLLLCVLCLFAIFQVVLFPSIYMQAFFGGLSLFYSKLLPLLFPFFFFCGVLLKTGALLEISQRFFSNFAKKLGLSGHFPYVFILACLSGYPMNAKLTKDLLESGEITATEGESLAFSTSCSGVLFVCGTVGAIMFESPIIGAVLMICHLSAAILGYFTFRFFDNAFNKNITAPQFSATKTIGFARRNFEILPAISESVASALSSVLLVCAYVCIFSVISKMLDVLGLYSHLDILQTGLIQGILEITLGISTISTLGTSPLCLAACCALISFGGISINLQSLGLLISHGISGKRYFILKTIQMFWGFSIALCVFFILL